MNFFDVIISVILGIVEGITEWLPISSTGHMILVNEFIGNDSFTSTELYLYVIQLGAVLAVVTLFFKKLNPFSLKKTNLEKKNTWIMWFKVIVACLPAVVFGLLLNDFMENFENWYVVSCALIIYGIAFLFIENKKKPVTVNSIDELSYKTAFIIGLFQVLSIVPGTSRSGSTILGAMIIGCSRVVAAEFTFFLAIPVMFGVSLLKGVSYAKDVIAGELFISSGDIILLIIGMVVAYITSLFVIKKLMEYVKHHDFKFFGKYRIVLGIVVIAFFLIKMLINGLTHNIIPSQW